MEIQNPSQFCYQYAQNYPLSTPAVQHQYNELLSSCAINSAAQSAYNGIEGYEGSDHSSSAMHPFHENINWIAYGQSNPGNKCPPMSAHAYAIARRNERERSRVGHINTSFEKLRRRLPYFGGRKRKLSKVDTLRTAAKYIEHLQQLINSSDNNTSSSDSTSCKDSVKTKDAKNVVIKREREDCSSSNPCSAKSDDNISQKSKKQRTSCLESRLQSRCDEQKSMFDVDNHLSCSSYAAITGEMNVATEYLLPQYNGIVSAYSTTDSYNSSVYSTCIKTEITDKIQRLSSCSFNNNNNNNNKNNSNCRNYVTRPNKGEFVSNLIDSPSLDKTNTCCAVNGGVKKLPFIKNTSSPVGSMAYEYGQYYRQDASSPQSSICSYGTLPECGRDYGIHEGFTSVLSHQQHDKDKQQQSCESPLFFTNL